MCSKNTVYYSRFPANKQYPTTHSSMHPTNKPCTYPSVQPSFHPFIQQAFIEPTLSIPILVLGLQKWIRHSPCSEESQSTQASHLFFKDFIYFILRGREREREAEKQQCVVASHTPPTGTQPPQPRHVPQPWIQPATPWFAGQHSIHWATPARAQCLILYMLLYTLCRKQGPYLTPITPESSITKAGTM